MTCSGGQTGSGKNKPPKFSAFSRTNFIIDLKSKRRFDEAGVFPEKYNSLLCHITVVCYQLS